MISRAVSETLIEPAKIDPVAGKKIVIGTETALEIAAIVSVPKTVNVTAAIEIETLSETIVETASMSVSGVEIVVRTAKDPVVIDPSPPITVITLLIPGPDASSVAPTIAPKNARLLLPHPSPKKTLIH